MNKETKQDKNWGFENSAAEDKEIDKKQEIKSISSLISALVVYASLTKSAEKYDDDFPGLPSIREELQAARGKAVDIMKKLLQTWDIETG